MCIRDRVALPLTLSQRELGGDRTGAPWVLTGQLERASPTGVVVRHGETEVMVTASEVPVPGPITYQLGGVDLIGKRVIIVDPVSYTHLDVYKRQLCTRRVNHKGQIC